MKQLHPAIVEFQQMRARAYSNVSLKRPLSESEYREFKSAMKDAYPEAYGLVFKKESV